MSLTYGTVLTEGYNWPQHSVGLVNVSPIPIQSDPVSQRPNNSGWATANVTQIYPSLLVPREPA
jgi:hypothetical protein